MAGRNDQVFAVSLSEIAFTLILVLMLLLGYMLLEERAARENAEGRVRDAVVQQSQEAASVELRRAREALQAEMRRAGAADPDRLVAAVVASGEKTTENRQLRQEIVDLTKKLTALDEMRTRVESLGRDSQAQLTREEIERALVLKREVERATADQMLADNRGSAAAKGQKADVTRIVSQALTATRELHLQSKEKLQRPISPGDEPRAIREIITAASESIGDHERGPSLGALRAENEKVTSQLRFYEKRDKLRGLDHPPCWMDRESRIEYIFNVKTVADGYVVTPGWLPHRESDARGSEGFGSLMGRSGAALSAEQFSEGAKPFLDFGKKQSPECRHFVYLSSSITNADQRDEARRRVNSFFYVLEKKAQ